MSKLKLNKIKTHQVLPHEIPYYLMSNEYKLDNNGNIVQYKIRCAYCLKEHDVYFHHIYGRRYKCIADELINLVPLCNWHHTYDTTFSAHLTPGSFMTWLERKYPGRITKIKELIKWRNTNE